MARRRAIAAAAIGLFASLSIAPAHAQGSRTERLLNIFTDACGQFVGQPNELRSHLAPLYQRVAAQDQRQLLGGQPGLVWHTSGDQDYLIYSYDSGECAVMTDGIPADAMREALRNLMGKLAKFTKAVVKLRSDTMQTRANRETRILTYAAGNPNARNGVEYVLITERGAPPAMTRLSATFTDMTQ